MRLLAAGDNVVDRYLDTKTMYPGGNAVNVAVYARRHGADAAYWGVLGTDEAGDTVLTALIEEDVDVSGVRRREGPNAYADVVLLNHDRVFQSSDDGVSAFELCAADYERLTRFDVVHTAYSGSLVDCVPDLARVTKVSFDFSYRREPEYTGALLPYLYLAAFSGSGLDADDVSTLLTEGIRHGALNVLVTCGSDGAWLSDGHKVYHQPAVQAAVVDTMGAGDAFIARLLIGLVGAQAPAVALEAAAHAAAVACSIEGGFGYPTRLPEAVRSQILQGESS